MSRSFTLSGFGSSADGNTALTLANSVVVSNATSNVIVNPLSVAIGNSSVFNSINATSYNGTANNSLYLGGTAAASYVTTSTIGGLTANNTAYLGGLAASGYQTTAGLSANVATLSANNASYLGGTAAASYVTTSTIGGLTANNSLYLGGTAAASYALLAGPTFTGTVSSANISSTGTINAASHSVGTAFVANTTQVTISGIPLSANGSTGTAGQLLTSNGATGAPYWQSVTTFSTSSAYTFTGIHSYNVGGNTIYMANTTSNWISWGTAGVAAPAVTTKSAGTKLVLYDGIGSTSVDYALGIEGGHMWFSTTNTATGFKWYANTTNIMTANTTGLYMTGTLAINSSGGALTANNSAYLGGTAAASYVTTSTIGGLTANNSAYLGGTAAASYLTTSSASSTYLPLSGGTLTGTIYSSTTSIVIGQNGGVNRGYLYNDTTGFGLLTSGGAWAVQVQYGTNTVYFPGYAYSAASLRAPVFYDTDNTGYYVDPASTSNLNLVQMNAYGSYFRSYQNTGYAGSVGSYVGYSTAAEGACTSFHRGGYYALNMGLDSDNVFRIGGWSAAANRLQLDMSGNFYVAGNVTAYSSDERLKENIVTISDPIGMVKRLRGVFYDWREWVNEDFGFNPIDRHDIGVIAQETQKVIPQAVKTAGFDTGLHGKSETGERYLTVQMEKIIPVLIESVKELVNRVEYLEAELAKK
jgi:hypothetical protein